jgi:hypothetical protein
MQTEYSDICKVFAWWPVRLTSKRWIWLRPVYYRFCIPISLIHSEYSWIECYNEADAMVLILQGSNMSDQSSLTDLFMFISR